MEQVAGNENWQLYVQRAHGVNFLHFDCKRFVPSVMKDVQKYIDGLPDDTFAVVEKHRHDIYKLAEHLGGKHIGTDENCHVFVWEK